jgi:hypothetical protein
MSLFDFLFRKPVKTKPEIAAVSNLASQLLERAKSLQVSSKASAESSRPTNEQIEHANRLGITISPSMSSQELHQLIRRNSWRAKPPFDWQLKEASKFGITVTPDMSSGQLGELIERANFAKPPTNQQLKKAKTLGVSVSSDLTYGQVEKLLEEAIQNQPVTLDQFNLCKRLGIVLAPEATYGNADKIITGARQDPKYDSEFRKIDVEEEDRELRKLYDGKVVDALRQWRQICEETGAKFLLIFQRGKQVITEVVELNSEPEIVMGKTLYIQLSFLLPEKQKVDRGYYSLEWEKEMNIPVSKVLHIQKIDNCLSNCSIIDSEESEDFLAYKDLIEKGQQFSKTLTPS